MTKNTLGRAPSVCSVERPLKTNLVEVTMSKDTQARAKCVGCVERCLKTKILRKHIKRLVLIHMGKGSMLGVCKDL